MVRKVKPSKTDVLCVIMYLKAAPLPRNMFPMVLDDRYFMVRRGKVFMRGPYDPWLNRRLWTAIENVLGYYAPDADVGTVVRRGKNALYVAVRDAIRDAGLEV